MAFEYNEDNFWSGASFCQEDLDTISVAPGTFYEGVPLVLLVDTSNPHYGGGSFNDMVSIPSPEWTQVHPSSEEVSPSTGKPGAPNTFSRGGSQGSQTPRRPSAEAIARRRKQNRVSQAAWRARNKELVEELRQEINEYSEYSQSMRETMQSLLETTESLKGVIVRALTSAPPQPSKEIQRIGAEEQLMSPESSHDGPVQDYECTGTQRLT